jgi:hypothetical protein
MGFIHLQIEWNPWLGDYRPPDHRSLCPLSSTELVDPPPTHTKSWVRHCLLYFVKNAWKRKTRTCIEVTEKHTLKNTFENLYIAPNTWQMTCLCTAILASEGGQWVGSMGPPRDALFPDPEVGRLYLLNSWEHFSPSLSSSRPILHPHFSSEARQLSFTSGVPSKFGCASNSASNT